MSGALPDEHHRNVPCVACSLMCDDLDVSVTRNRAEAGGLACARARKFYERVSNEVSGSGSTALIGGQPAPYDQAVKRCAEILGAAKQPLVAGLDADVAGVRAALRLAERFRATVDTIDGDALFRNIAVMQTEGWLATTLGEARNRADLLMIFGKQPVDEYPRLLERLAAPAETLFDMGGQRGIFLLGPEPEQPPRGLGESRLTSIPAGPEALAELAGALRARLDGHQPVPRPPAGIEGATLQGLVDRLREARYPVLIWSAAEFDFPHGDLGVQRLVELAQSLGKQTRCTTIALSRASSTTTATQVSGWTCGFPPRVSFAGGAPDYDPYRYSNERLLARGEADALLWIASTDVDTPPPTAPIPRIVLSARHWPTHADDVFVRLGVPGVDHGGQMFRVDGIPLTLRTLRKTRLPTAATVLDDIRGHAA